MKERDCKIINYIGVDSKVGTTMIAHSIAQCLVSSGKKTLLICFGGPEGIQYSKIDESINKTQLGSEYEKYPVIQSEYHCKGLDILVWNESRMEKQPIHPSLIKEFLELIKGGYEAIVLDSGYDFYSGLAIGNLEEANENFVVTTQQRNSLLKLKILESQVLTPLGIKARLVINKFIEGAFATEKEIVGSLNFEGSNVIRYCGYGWEAEQDQSTLLKYPKYYKDFRKYEKTI